MQYLSWPLIAVHSSGNTIVLYNEAAVFNFLAEYGAWNTYHTHVDVSDWGPYQSMYRKKAPNTWIVRDDNGIIVLSQPFVKAHYDNKWHGYRFKRAEQIKRAMELGLPIPGTSKLKAGWKMDHMAKKNSGHGRRNRERAVCEYERKEYGIEHTKGQVARWEY